MPCKYNFFQIKTGLNYPAENPMCVCFLSVLCVRGGSMYPNFGLFGNLKTLLPHWRENIM